MAVDTADRTRWKCKNRDCPVPGRVIDLTAGNFIDDGTDLWHQACYADKAAPKDSAARTAKRQAARDADAALVKAAADEVAKAAADAAAAEQKARDDAEAQRLLSAAQGSPGATQPADGTSTATAGVPAGQTGAPIPTTPPATGAKV
jgi:hypothetical protein